jgi:hypothetical protein
MILILISLIFLVTPLSHNLDARRIREINENIPVNFQPLITLLQEYWGDAFEKHINFLLDVYTVWEHEKNDELVKTKLTELRQFHPILYPWIIGIRASLKWMNGRQKREIIRDQLWQAVPQPARRNLETLLKRNHRTEKEKEFVEWLFQNNYTLQEAIFQLISRIYKAISAPEVDILDFQLHFSP